MGRFQDQVVLSAYGKVAAGVARHLPGLLPRVLGSRRRRGPASRGGESSGDGPS